MPIYYSPRKPRLQARALILRVVTFLGILAASYVVLVWAFGVPPTSWATATLPPIFMLLIVRNSLHRGEVGERRSVQ